MDSFVKPQDSGNGLVTILLLGCFFVFFGENDPLHYIWKGKGNLSPYSRGGACADDRQVELAEGKAKRPPAAQ